MIPWDIIAEYMPPAYAEGIIKYERESWRRGFHVSKMFEAATRHMIAFQYYSEDLDPEALEKYGIEKHHLAGAIFSLLSILHTMKYRPDLDDRRHRADGNFLINQFAATSENKNEKE
jgi:hypothetical protein